MKTETRNTIYLLLTASLISALLFLGMNRIRDLKSTDSHEYHDKMIQLLDANNQLIERNNLLFENNNQLFENNNELLKNNLELLRQVRKN